MRIKRLSAPLSEEDLGIMTVSGDRQLLNLVQVFLPRDQYRVNLNS
jgi:hypothetical protein